MTIFFAGLLARVLRRGIDLKGRDLLGDCGCMCPVDICCTNLWAWSSPTLIFLGAILPHTLAGQISLKHRLRFLWKSRKCHVKFSSTGPSNWRFFLFKETNSLPSDGTRTGSVNGMRFVDDKTTRRPPTLEFCSGCLSPIGGHFGDSGQIIGHVGWSRPARPFRLQVKPTTSSLTSATIEKQLRNVNFAEARLERLKQYTVI